MSKQETINVQLAGWQGMLSIWGQEDRAYQGVCYSQMTYSPEKSIKVIAQGGPPVTYWHIRWCDLQLANFWLGYLADNVLPDSLKQKVVFTRVMSKANWPQKYMQEMDKADIIDIWEVQDVDGFKEEDFRKARKGKYAGCLPWLKTEVSQDASSFDMFALAVLLRYVSEHVPTIMVLKLLPQMYPEIPTQYLLPIAMHLGRAGGHAVGVNGTYYPKGLGEQIKSMDFKANWEKMIAKKHPFWKEPKKCGAVDDFFKPKLPHVKPGQHPSTVLGEPFYASYDYNSTLTRNGITMKLAHNKPQAFMDLALKELA